MAKDNDLWPDAPGTTGSLVPLRRDPQGSLHLAWPGAVHSLVNSTYNALKGPGELLTGRTPLGSPAHPDPFRIAQDLAGFMGGSGAPLERVPGSLAMFGGIRAKTANMQALSAALTHEGRGASPQHIWEQTGWFRGADNKWRFEIPDAGANTPFFDRGNVQSGTSLPLGKFLTHPELHAAYPGLGKIAVQAEDLPSGAGVFYPSTDTIGLAPGSRKVTTSTTLHEVQHAIQKHEGFAKGGSPEDFLPPSHYNREAIHNLGWDRLEPEIEAHGVDPEKVTRAMQRFAQGRPLGDSAWDVKKLGEENPELLERVRQHFNNGTQLVSEKLAASQAYNSLAGEVEARNVQERHEHGYGAETPPWETPGAMPLEQQRVILPDGTEQPSLSMAPVDHDPWASGPNLVPVEHDPWKHQVEPVSHDPFEAEGKSP